MVRSRAYFLPLLTLSIVACGDDVAGTDSSGGATSTTEASSSGTTGTGTSTGTPTTGVEPTGTATTDVGTSTTETATTDMNTSTTDTSTTGTSTTGTSTTGTSTTDTSTTGTGTTGTSTTDTSTTGTGTTDTGTTGAACGPGEPGPDADGDTVPDACDQCPGADDLADADGDAVADGCDQCPGADDALDGDGDGVADGCDQCLTGDDAVDTDNDGTPDACDDLVLFPIEKPIDDYDVAGDGALVVVRGEAGSIFATCWNGDRSVRRAEFVAGTYDAGQQLGPYPTIHIARQAQKVLVTWFDRAGAPANHRIAYSLLDDACQPIVTSATAIAAPDAYFEFHDAAIDAAGNSAIAVSPNETLINFVDAAGVVGTQQQAFDINAVYGTHVAVNQASGGGIVAAQQHSGNGIFYRRFDPDGTWIEAGPMQVSVNYHYWYDGYTVGMNDNSEFVFLWRSDGTALDMRFFAADAGVVADVQRATIDFEGWDGGHCYDSFRRRHQEIPLRGDDFVLGEVYNWITPQDNRVVHHFQYTPAGQLVAEDMTTTNLDEGLTIRVDQVGNTYLRGPAGIEIVADYP